MLKDRKWAAAELGVSQSTVVRLIEKKGLPSYRIGGQYRFNRDEVETWLQAQRTTNDNHLQAQR